MVFNILYFYDVAVKLIGKLNDGTVFLRKGYYDELPFEFMVDEGNSMLQL